MGNDVKKWHVFCILLLLDFLSLSCSQVVAPVEGSTDCLKLHFFVRTGLGTIKYGLFESLRPNSDQEMSVSDLLDHEASGAVHFGSVPIEEEGRRISREVCKLKPGTAYDLYYVTETYGSNGLFSPVGSTMNISTHEIAPEIEDISVIACPGRADSIQLNMTLDGSSGGGARRGPRRGATNPRRRRRRRRRRHAVAAAPAAAAFPVPASCSSLPPPHPSLGDRFCSSFSLKRAKRGHQPATVHMQVDDFVWVVAAALLLLKRENVRRGQVSMLFYLLLGFLD